MGLIEFNGAIVLGNFAKVTKKRPKNWMDKDYKIIIPFDFKWRHKIGKVECDCKTCYEHYQPYLGFTWYHSDECAIMKLLKERPHIQNLIQYYDRDLRMIAQTE